MNQKKTLNFKISSSPYSTDPLDYDAYSHHVAFGSVYATLVTQYSPGKILGVIAKNWSNSNQSKEWSFTIKENLLYDNGDIISPARIAQSFTRTAYLMKEKGSNDVFPAKLKGIQKLSSPNGLFEGVQYIGNTITFKFAVPVPDLLELISFGLFGIVHPSNYDKETGKWIDNKSIVASGNYSLLEWSTSHLILSLRNNHFLNIGHPKKYENIKIDWNSKNESFDMEI